MSRTALDLHWRAAGIRERERRIAISVISDTSERIALLSAQRLAPSLRHWPGPKTFPRQLLLDLAEEKKGSGSVPHDRSVLEAERESQGP